MVFYISAEGLAKYGFWHGRGIRTFIAPASIPTVPRKTVEMEYESILQWAGFSKGETGAGFGRGDASHDCGCNRTCEDCRSSPQGIDPGACRKKSRSLWGKTLAGNILQQAGGELLAPQERQIGMERLLELNPDVIFLVTIESDYGREGEIKIDCIK